MSMKIIEDVGVITKTEYDLLPHENKVKYWRIGGNKFKLIEKLDSEHLQSAFCYAQTKELVAQRPPNKQMLPRSNK